MPRYTSLDEIRAACKAGKPKKGIQGSCWLFGKASDAPVIVRAGAGRGGTVELARLAYSLARGVKVGNQKKASPICGRAHCVNPDHLIWVRSSRGEQ